MNVLDEDELLHVQEDIARNFVLNEPPLNIEEDAKSNHNVSEG